MVLHVNMRELGYCNKGGRLFFAKHKLNWREFVLKGLDEEVLLATGDAMAIKVVDNAHGR